MPEGFVQTRAVSASSGAAMERLEHREALTRMAPGGTPWAFRISTPKRGFRFEITFTLRGSLNSQVACRSRADRSVADRAFFRTIGPPVREGGGILATDGV